MTKLKNILIVVIAFSISSCLTERRFNKVLTKGIEKGWIDTTVKAGNYVYINKIDTPGIQYKTDSLIDTIFQDVTIYKDTCFNKQGKVIGRITDTSKLKHKLKKSVPNELILPELIHCLKKPLFYNKDGILVEVSQDSLGQFNIKVKAKTISVSRPDDRSWYKKYIFDVWMLWWVIVILLFVIWIKR